MNTSSEMAVVLKDSTRNEKPASWIMNRFMNPDYIGDRYPTEKYYTEMTKELAGFLYEHRNSENRKIRTDWVRAIMRDIRSGNWHKTCDGLKFCFVKTNDGVSPVVGDAHHRLLAFYNVALEDGDIPGGCIIGISVCNPEEISKYTDKSIKRTDADSLRIDGEDPEMAKIINRMSYIHRSTLGGKVSSDEISAGARIYKPMHDVVASIESRSTHSARVVAEAAILSAAKVNGFTKDELEKAAKMVYDYMDIMFFRRNGIARLNKEAKEYIRVLEEAQCEKHKTFSGFCGIRVAGLATVALLENRFRGKKHRINQRSYDVKTGEPKWDVEPELVNAYTSDTLFKE